MITIFKYRMIMQRRTNPTSPCRINLTGFLVDSIIIAQQTCRLISTKQDFMNTSSQNINLADYYFGFLKKISTANSKLDLISKATVFKKQGRSH